SAATLSRALLRGPNAQSRSCAERSVAARKFSNSPPAPVPRNRRQPYGESRAAFLSIGRLDPSVVFFDDPARDGQSESRAFANLFSRKERAEDMREIPRRYPRTGVRPAQPDKCPAVYAPLFGRNLDQQPASLRRCVQRVDTNVHQRLSQQSRVTFDKFGVMIV